MGVDKNTINQMRICRVGNARKLDMSRSING
jgi:hypothetical protein